MIHSLRKPTVPHIDAIDAARKAERTQPSAKAGAY
jgi:hypothetical protein